ncbi:MAG: DUF1064 domain-containing protein [Eubacteriales bacterium]|nr:DUF1064 domain-containing protein [Eubacteriales bacterium]
MSKYHSKKITIDGITYDSKKEARRHQELLLLERAGEITNLERQVKFTLIPAQREYTNEIYTKGRKKGCFKPGKLLERECAYIADFVYREGDRCVVEDTKGFRTPEYIIKRKLMLHNFGIRIKEV